MKKQIIRILLFLSLTPLLSLAQPVSPESTSYESRIFTGGSLGLQFGTYTLIEIAPIVGYKVTEKFTPGISVTYIYSKFKDPYGGFSYSTNIYGGSVFARYYILENIFAHVECEILNMEVPNTSNYYSSSVEYHRQNVAGIFIGGGYREAIGDRSSINILLLYDINEDPFSPYQNPVIKLSFGFGI